MSLMKPPEKPSSNILHQKTYQCGGQTANTPIIVRLKSYRLQTYIWLDKHGLITWSIIHVLGKWSASSGWPFRPNITWGSIKTTTFGKTHSTLHTFELKFWMKPFLNIYFRISSREWITGEYSFDSNRIKFVISIRLWSPTIGEWFWSSTVCKWIFRDPKSWSTLQWWQGAFWSRIFRSLDPWILSTQIKPTDNSSFGSIDNWKSFVACSWSLRLNRFNETQAR